MHTYCYMTVKTFSTMAGSTFHNPLPLLQTCETRYIPLDPAQLQFASKFVIAPVLNDPGFNEDLHAFGVKNPAAWIQAKPNEHIDSFGDEGRGLGFFRAMNKDKPGSRQNFEETSKGRVLFNMLDNMLKQQRRIMIYTSLATPCGKDAAVAIATKVLQKPETELYVVLNVPNIKDLHEKFNNNGEAKIVIVCDSPEGFGLIGIDHVIFLEAMHDFIVYEQAIGRARRSDSHHTKNEETGKLDLKQGATVQVHVLVSTLPDDSVSKQKLRAAISYFSVTPVLLGAVAAWTFFSKFIQPQLKRLSGASQMPAPEYAKLKARLELAASGSPYGSPAFLRGAVDLTSLLAENRNDEVFRKFFRGPVLKPLALIFYAMTMFKLVFAMPTRRNFQEWLGKQSQLSQIDLANFVASRREPMTNPFEATTPDLVAEQGRKAQGSEIKAFFEALKQHNLQKEDKNLCSDEGRRKCIILGEQTAASAHACSRAKGPTRKLFPVQLNLVEKLTHLRCDKASQGCLIALFMGMGKSMAALAVVYNNSDSLKHLYVVCPRYLDQNWKSEIAKSGFTSGMKWSIMHYEDDPPRLDETEHSNSAVILDECHRARDHKKDAWLEFMKPARLRLALSGTPAKNVKEMLHLLYYVQGGINIEFSKYVKIAARGSLLRLKQVMHLWAPSFLLALPALDFLAGNSPALLLTGAATYVASTVLAARNWEADLNAWDFDALAEDFAPWIYYKPDDNTLNKAC